MADVQHKSIIDPNIHEPKGVKYAQAGTVYIANGSGSGVWGEVLTPGDLGVTPSALFTLDRTITSAQSSGSLFPGTWNTSYAWGDIRIDKLSGFLQVNKTGIYLVSATYSIISDAAFNILTIQPTRTLSSLTHFQPTFFSGITATTVPVSQPMQTGIVVNLTAGQGFGLWATVNTGQVDDARVTATIQMTRLSDG